MIRSRLVTPPDIEPVTVEEAKVQARVEHDADDALIEQLIAAARDAAEQRTGRALITQTWQQRGRPRDDVLELRRWPAIEVLSVSDEDGALSAADWRSVVGEAPEVELLNDPGGEITVEYTAGYGATAEVVPASIRQWILIAVSTMYEHREGEVTGTIVSEVGYVDNLLNDYRVPAG